MRIALIISSLDSGGAERVLSGMASYWAAAGHEVALITLSDPLNDWYNLHPKVERVGLGLLMMAGGPLEAMRNNLLRVWRVRRALVRFGPDVVISFIEKTNILALLACIGLRVPVIVSERADPREKPVEPVWNRLRAWTYGHADAIVVQSAALRSWAEQFSGPRTVHVIPNPVRSLVGSEEGGGELFAKQEKLVIAMGRLTHQKGFDVLISAFARCLERQPEWRLIILGEGEERPHLETQVAALGIADRVSLPGVVRNPERKLRQAEFFVLSSRWEGFPNALLEAMACGLPVVATDCPTGPADIIREGVDGLLAPPNDAVALAHVMEQVMTDRSLRLQLGSNASTVHSRFSEVAIMRNWEMIVASIQQQPAARRDGV